MPTIVSDVAFTPAVKAAQELRGSRKGYARMEECAASLDQGPELAYDRIHEARTL